MEKKTALVVGATGLVGKELLQILLDATEYGRLIAIVRRPIDIDYPKLKVAICNFDKLEELDKECYNVDDVFCCLGTTIKKAKTQEAMHKIDVEYPTLIAKLAKENGAKHFLLVSSMNADSSSRIFYPRIKGQLEDDIKNIPYERISIFRPSILLGDRNENRFGEKLAIKIYRLIEFVARKPIPKLGIEVKTVAYGMYKAAQTDCLDRVVIYNSGKIAEF